MNIINFTPHSVIIIRDGEVFREYLPSGRVAKLIEWDATIPDPKRGFVISGGGLTLDDVRVVAKLYGDVQIISRQDFLGIMNLLWVKRLDC